MNQLTDKINGKQLTNFNNPFGRGNVMGVYMRAFKSEFTGDKVYITGKVEFRSGNTKGEQEFEGTDLNDIAKQIQEFINNLE